jgi:hypothetical protein
VKTAPVQHPSAAVTGGQARRSPEAQRPEAAQRQRNVRLLVVLLGVVAGLLVASILFVAFRS